MIRIVATIEIDEDFESLEEFCRKYARADIHEVGGKGVAGNCLNCGSLLYVDDWEGGIFTCENCDGADDSHELVVL